MQVNKQIIIILILASLLFSAVGSAFYFYKKNKQAQQSKDELVTVFIAKENIKKGTLLTVKNLAKTKIARQYLLNKPLLKKEILGKYTNETIYQNEIFLKQKLTTKILKEKLKILDFTNSSYNFKFKNFENPNYTLIQGDFINIISVLPKGELNKKGKYTDFDTQYVANNIKVLGFIRDGYNESEVITKQKIKRVVKKKTVEEVIDVKADELILDMNPQVLLKLLTDYNKGNQLWMVKTKESIKVEEDKKELQVEPLKPVVKVVKKTVKKTVPKRVFKYQMYQASNSFIRKNAIIDYSNDKEGAKSKTKSVLIKVNSSKLCKTIKDKFVVGTSYRYNVRSDASLSSKTKKLYNKNTIFPYIKKHGAWYEICDGQFVNSSVVKEVSASFVQKKVGTK